MKMGQTADWEDPAVLTKFLRLWDDGSLSTAEIGRRMGISKSAVCGKAGRLDLPRRKSPIKPRKLDTVLNRHRWAKPMPAAKPVIVAPKPVVMVPVFVGRIRECCWPMSNVGRKWTFCDAPTIPGKDYCEPHHAIGFYKPRVRGEIGGGRSNASADA